MLRIELDRLINAKPGGRGVALGSLPSFLGRLPRLGRLKPLGQPCSPILTQVTNRRPLDQLDHPPWLHFWT